MLVKHNLSPFYDMSKTKVYFWSRGKYKGYVIDDVIIVEAEENPVYPNFRVNLPINTDEKTISQLTVSNVGNVDIIAKKKSWENCVVIRPGETKKCTFITKVNETIEFSTPERSVAKFKAKASIINKGTELSDVYLPNINTLPEDKQPLYPPEGDYKEIQPQ